MGNGRDERSDGKDDGPTDGWDGGTRRQFLIVLVATVSGALTTIYVYFQDMLETTLDIDERTESPPTDVFVQEHDSGYSAAYGDGDIIDSGTDGWAILQTAIRTIPEGGNVFVRGRYEATEPIEIDKSLRIDGHGASIDVRNSANVAFDIHGTERYRTELAERASTGAYTIQLDSTRNVEQGDMVLIEEEDGPGVLGRGQPPGEPHSVLDVDGDTITLEDTIVWRDGYDDGTLVYVTDPIEIRCSGFDLDGPAKDDSYIGIIARECRDSMFEDLWLDKFGSRGIALEGCANTRVRDCTVLRSSDIEASDGYGIQVRAGCHDIVVEGCTAKECRHPFSITPAGHREVASRSVTVRDCFVSADGSAALNCHGGSAHDIDFQGCMVHTWGEPGVRTGAQKTNVTGCEFRMDGHHAVTTRNDGQEMVLTVTDTDVYGATNAVSLSNGDSYEFTPLWKLVHVDGVRANGCKRLLELESGELDRVRELLVRNCNWDNVAEAGIRIENTLEGGTIESNAFGDAPNDSHIRARNDDTEIRNLRISGNRFQKTDGQEPFIRLAQARRCVISDNSFEADTAAAAIYADGSESSQNVIKDNTYFAPDASENAIDADDDSIATDNIFNDVG